MNKKTKYILTPRVQINSINFTVTIFLKINNKMKTIADDYPITDTICGECNDRSLSFDDCRKIA